MTSDKKPQARVTDKKRVFNGFFKMDQYEIEMDTHNGGTQKLTRLVFERGHAVGVLPYDPVRDEVLLGNEMRPGILAAGEDPYADALIAGMIDAGEEPIDAAIRETQEETGQVLQNPVLIHEGSYVSPGGTSERIALVIGTIDMTKAGGVHGKASEGESIKSVIISSDEFIRRAEQGDLKDMKTLVMAFWLASHKKELQQHLSAQKPPQP